MAFHQRTPLILTLAGLAITAKAEAGTAAARSCLVAVAQQADIGATSRLPKLIQGACMTANWAEREV